MRNKFTCNLTLGGGGYCRFVGYSLFNSFDSWKKEIVLKNQV